MESNVWSKATCLGPPSLICAHLLLLASSSAAVAATDRSPDGSMATSPAHATLPPIIIICPPQNDTIGALAFHRKEEGDTLELTCAIVDDQPLSSRCVGADGAPAKPGSLSSSGAAVNSLGPSLSALQQRRFPGRSSVWRDYDFEWHLPNPPSHDRQEVRAMMRRHASTILIHDLRPEDSGIYACLARDKSSAERDSTLRREVVVRVVRRKNRNGCGKGFFPCPTGVCIGLRFVCDGVDDCPPWRRTAKAEPAEFHRVLFQGGGGGGGAKAADEERNLCGVDPCAAKLRCEDRRCLDPNSCCNPDVEANCTDFNPCCRPLMESNRRSYHAGQNDRDAQYHELNFLHSTAYTIVGCVVAFILVFLVVTAALCRLHLKRGLGLRYPVPGGGGGGGGGAAGVGPRGAGQYHPPLTLHDLDVYFASLRRVESNVSVDQPVGAAPSGASVAGGGGGHIGITYNINNGVQIVGRPLAPPPYSLEAGQRSVGGAAATVDPPPPYNAHDRGGRPATAAAAAEAAAENDALLNNNEDNNNGDINGNSEVIDNNLVAEQLRQRALAAEQQATRRQQHREQLLHLAAERRGQQQERQQRGEQTRRGGEQVQLRAEALAAAAAAAAAQAGGRAAAAPAAPAEQQLLLTATTQQSWEAS